MNMNDGHPIAGYKYFESQQDDEKVELIVRRHWTVLLAPFVVGTVIIILTFIITFLLLGSKQVVVSEVANLILVCVVSLVVLYTILYVFLSWLIRYLNLIIVTNEHLVEIEHSALFSRKVSELDLDCIEDSTSHHSGFFQTTLNYGNVLIQTAGEIKNFEFKNISHPEIVAQKIMELKETYMAKNRVVASGNDH